MLPVREMKSAADVYANIRRLRGVFYPPRQMAPTRVTSTAERTANDSDYPAQTRRNDEKFPADGISLETFNNPAEVVAVMPVPSTEEIVASFHLFCSNEEKAMPSLRDLLLKVSEVFGIPLNELKSERRATRLVNARHAFFFVARGLTDRSFPKIGLYCGGRDHTTVIHGVRRCERLMAEDEGFRAQVNAVASHFGGAA